VKPIVFALKRQPDQRLDLAPLVPHLLAGKSGAEIAAIELQTTREKLTAGDIFKIEGGDLQSIRFEGGSERFDNIGHGLKGGSIVVDGNAGKAIARFMSGGSVTVNGSVGPFAGSGLSGGTLDVRGDAGDFLGAPINGEMEGVSGGFIFVRGSAGERAGDRLRRGTIVVEGGAGDCPGSRMIAGTLIVLGSCGALPGYLMRRGTIVLANPPAFAPTFVDCGVHQLTFARVFSRLLEPQSAGAAELLLRPLRRLAGDTAALGKGEVFFPA
jgi:formylmethanofuran dehydrogenase subunit C